MYVGDLTSLHVIEGEHEAGCYKYPNRHLTRGITGRHTPETICYIQGRSVHRKCCPNFSSDE